MNGAIVARDTHPMHITNCLMAEADSKNRNLPAKRRDQLARDATLARSARTWRNHEILRAVRNRGRSAHRIIAHDTNLKCAVEHAEGLHEIPSERVVVVDEKQHGETCKGG